MSDPKLTLTIDPDQLQDLKDEITRDVLAHVKAAELERLIAVSEVAEAFGVTPEWVRHHQKDIGAYRLSIGGGRNPIRFRASHVERYLARRQLKSPRAGSWGDDDDWALG